MDIKEKTSQVVTQRFSITIPNAWSYVSLEVSTDHSNCKLSYIHGAGSLQYTTNEQKKEVIDHVLNSCKGYVILNTISKEVAEFVTENYDCYFHKEIPVGYNNGFQHIVCFRNHIKTNHNCKIPEKIVKKETVATKNVNTLNKKTIQQKLLGILKQKRRKPDYVEEFINSL